MSADDDFAAVRADGSLLERLRFRATAAEVNKQGITAALHAEAARELEALYAQMGEDRQTRWSLRARLDSALYEVARLEARMEALNVSLTDAHAEVESLILAGNRRLSEYEANEDAWPDEESRARHNRVVARLDERGHA